MSNTVLYLLQTNQVIHLNLKNYVWMVTLVVCLLVRTITTNTNKQVTVEPPNLCEVATLIHMVIYLISTLILVITLKQKPVQFQWPTKYLLSQNHWKPEKAYNFKEDTDDAKQLLHHEWIVYSKDQKGAFCKSWLLFRPHVKRGSF